MTHNYFYSTIAANSATEPLLWTGSVERGRERERGRE